MFKKIVYVLSFLHLGLIAVVIFHGLDITAIYSKVERPVGFLTAVNYAPWRFAFFTPDVGKSTEVEILLKGKNGEKKRYSRP